MDGRGGAERVTMGIPAALGLTLAAQVAFAGLGALLLWIFRHESLFRGLRPGLELGFITGAGVLTGVVTALVVVLAYRFAPGYRRSMAEVMRLMGFFSPPVLFVMAIPSALGEELLFRGSLQMLLGPLLVAVLFGLAHTAGQRRFWSYGLTAAVIGYFFGLAYQFTGELWVPILAHAVYNAVILVALSGRFTGVDGGQGIWYNTFCR